MNLLIGADFVPTETNYDLFKSGNIDELFGKELKEIILNADFRIFNLELPLTSATTPIKKNGPSLSAPEATVAAYTSAKVDLFTLANNHILDYGAAGLDTTIAVLNKIGIPFIGAGADAETAAKPYIFDFAGKRVGVYACAEHEFSIVTENSAGANPFDPLYSLDHIAALKADCDYVIVLYHGGKEHYRYPSPELQKRCRRMVEKGADLVVCQHSHCIGCEEKYSGATIVYGQGNFLFDHSKSEYWQTSLLISVDDNFNISYIPLVKSSETVRLADSTSASNILGDFNKRGEEILEPGFITKKYSEFADVRANYYFSSLWGIKRGFFFKVLNKISRGKYEKYVFKKKATQRWLLSTKNAVNCEAHSELLLAAIDNELHRK